jgi:hypothetical protein
MSITTDKRAQLHRALDHVLDRAKSRAKDGGVLTDDILFDVDQRAKTGSGKRTPASIAVALKYAAKKYDAEVVAALRRYYGVGAKDMVMDRRGARDSSKFEWTCPKCRQVFTGEARDPLEDRAWYHLEFKHNDISMPVKIKRSTV